MRIGTLVGELRIVYFKGNPTKGLFIVIQMVSISQSVSKCMDCFGPIIVKNLQAL